MPPALVGALVLERRLGAGDAAGEMGSRIRGFMVVALVGGAVLVVLVLVH
jgi:hypothetical protein